MNLFIQQIALLMVGSMLGYAIGYVNGMSTGPIIQGWLIFIAVLIVPLVLLKFGGALFWHFLHLKRTRFRGRGGDSGSSGRGYGPFPLVPRPPGRRPPVLRARQKLPV